MLKKPVTIKNVGKFRNYGAKGDITFGTATLIYAPNGRGKTTLCDILRSLKTGEGDVVLGRATLGATGAPELEILLDSGMVRFKDGKWTTTLPDLEIYDSRFIHENVYGGECVEHEQRRNLYSVIIGEKGVKLANDADTAAERSREATRSLKAEEAKVAALIPSGVMSVDAFVAIEKDADVDQKIAEAKKEVAALEKATELKAKPVLKKVSVPRFPEGLKALLAKTIEDVVEDAEKSIRRHMDEGMAERDEQWLVRGTDLIKGDQCPYCAQTLKANDLIAAYKTHFSGKYQELKNEIQAWEDRSRGFAGESTVLAIEQTVSTNAARLVEWANYVTSPEAPEIEVASVQRRLAALRIAATDAVQRKAAKPVEPVAVGASLQEALDGEEEAQALAAAYNKQVEIVNAVLERRKQEAETGDLAKAKRRLAELQARKTRHQPDCEKLCGTFKKAREHSKAVDISKEKAKTELEEYSRDVFQRYQGRINKLLENFGATFRIERIRERYKGGKPSSSYCLLIENEEVELGDTKTPLSKPSFKNTLSAGDKSALALAFFLAKLDQSEDISEKVVVLDDPFTSQDAGRQTCTQQEIRRLSRNAKQVVVLSHDRRFLKRVWDGLDSGAAKTLQLSQLGDTTITEWDIETVQDEYVQTYTTLWLYCNRAEGDPEAAVKTIRPLLEGYLRMKLPKEFAEDKWLGDYVKQIEEADANSPVGQAKGILDELVDIKDYARKHHHPPGSDAPDEPVVAAEVLAYGRRTLKLVESF